MTTQLEIGLSRAEDSASRHARLIGSLVELARELAWKAGGAGVTVSDVRLTAEQRGLLLPSNGRRLSFLGVVMKRAGLRATDRFRRSDVARSHGNLNRVFVL